MARPSSALKLAALEPLAVARDVCRAIVDHMHALGFHLGPSVEVRLHAPYAPADVPEGADPTVEGLARGSNLGLTVQALVTYAQRGLPVWDWEDDGAVMEAFLTVLPALYSCAGRPWSDAGAIDDEADPEEPIGLVLLGAHARARIAADDPVTARDLGVLAGIDTRHVRHLAEAGEIKRRSDGKYSAATARRWLAARAVPGFVRATS